MQVLPVYRRGSETCNLCLFIDEVDRHEIVTYIQMRCIDMQFVSIYRNDGMHILSI